MLSLFLLVSSSFPSVSLPPLPHRPRQPPPPALQGLLASIEATDSYTVRFTLNRLNTAFLQKLVFFAFGIRNVLNLCIETITP